MTKRWKKTQLDKCDYVMIFREQFLGENKPQERWIVVGEQVRPQVMICSTEGKEAVRNCTEPNPIDLLDNLIKAQK